MKDYHRFHQEIIKGSSILALFLLAAALLTRRFSLGIGIFLGASVALFNFWRLSLTTYHFVIKRKRPAALFLQYISRYALTGLALFLSLEYYGLNAFFGSFLGLLLPKLYILYQYLYPRKG